MKTDKRFNRIRTLMMVSQIMLLGLVVQWLSSQYKQNRILLEKELSGMYAKAEEMVIDTMLFQIFISPVLGDSVGRELRSDRLPLQIKRRDSSNQIVYTGVNRDSASQDYGNSSVSLYLSDSGINQVKVRRDTGKIVTDTDMALRGVRMIIHSDGDSIGKPGGLLRTMMQGIDSSLFMNSIENDLNETGLRVSVEFATRQDFILTGRTFHSGMLLGKSAPGYFPPVKVNGIGLEVLHSILPQILFGILLLVVTGTAFNLAQRSFKNQLIVSRIKDEFISNISHELKTPVATVKLAIETLGTHELKNCSGTVREYLRMASLETDRLDRLVSKVLDYGRMESSDTVFMMQKIDVEELLRKAQESMAEKVLATGATMKIVSERDLFVYGDQFYLESVLTNLIDNSLKYGCAEKCVTEVSANIMDGKVNISVRDNGPGIPDEYIPRVFDKFFRVPADNVHNIKGYGLGLSFARMVVINHNGSISVRNLPEGGCEFQISLPEYDQDTLC